MLKMTILRKIFSLLWFWIFKYILETAFPSFFMFIGIKLKLGENLIFWELCGRKFNFSLYGISLKKVQFCIKRFGKVQKYSHRSFILFNCYQTFYSVTKTLSRMTSILCQKRLTIFVEKNSKFSIVWLVRFCSKFTRM